MGKQSRAIEEGKAAVQPQGETEMPEGSNVEERSMDQVNRMKEKKQRGHH
ncbi:hypothetical protein [Bacillus solitudinis]|nr:hypothetical protein [Bacillus solitudinis]